MRIALLHSFYSSEQSSGENVVVEAQLAALAAAGQDVLLLGRHTDREQELPGYKARAAWRTVTSLGPDPGARLAAFGPDVVHVHNTVPNIGLRWLRSWPGPVVHTLHNFRPICANGLLFRDGHLCTDCPDGRPWSAVEHSCYRDSRVATLPIATRNTLGLRANPLVERSDALVVLSDYARDTFARYGVAPERLRLLANGIAAAHEGAVQPPAEPRWLAIGRLRAEKGLAELLRAWPVGLRLDIIGDGPQRDELAALAPEGVRLLGALPPAQLRSMLPDYSGLVFTSLAPESATPLVVVEALEAGVPVLIVESSPHAPALIAQGVAHGLGGVADPAGITRACAWAIAGGLGLRARCREHYEERFTAEQWVAGLLSLYREVIAERALMTGGRR